MVRLDQLTLAACAFCVVIAVVQISDHHRATSLLQRQAATQKLGEDADWNVHHWSKKHIKYVEGGAVDAASVKNIWHSKKQAWAGIDDILPTGGEYGYESNHWMPADGAKLLGFVNHAKKELNKMEERLPANVPKDEANEEGQVLGVLDGDLQGLASIKGELTGSVKNAKKGQQQMLAQAPGRVFVDDALYGEGIVGDVKSQGHKKMRWSRKAAEADMDSYYNSLDNKIRAANSFRHHVQSLTAAGKPATGSNADMDNYFAALDEAAVKKHAAHKHILNQEGYFHSHPMEHKHLHAWIESQEAAGLPHEKPAQVQKAQVMTQVTKPTLSFPHAEVI